jgi:hypothetical protein
VFTWPIVTLLLPFADPAAVRDAEADQHRVDGGADVA